MVFLFIYLLSSFFLIYFYFIVIFNCGRRPMKFQPIGKPGRGVDSLFFACSPYSSTTYLKSPRTPRRSDILPLAPTWSTRTPHRSNILPLASTESPAPHAGRIRYPWHLPSHPVSLVGGACYSWHLPSHPVPHSGRR